MIARIGQDKGMTMFIPPNRWCHVPAAAALAATMFSGQAFAQSDAGDAVTLDEITVSAPRVDTPLARVPSASWIRNRYNVPGRVSGWTSR